MTRAYAPLVFGPLTLPTCLPTYLDMYLPTLPPPLPCTVIFVFHFGSVIVRGRSEEVPTIVV